MRISKMEADIDSLKETTRDHEKWLRWIERCLFLGMGFLWLAKLVYESFVKP